MAKRNIIVFWNVFLILWEIVSHCFNANSFGTPSKRTTQNATLANQVPTVGAFFSYVVIAVEYSFVYSTNYAFSFIREVRIQSQMKR
jgi:hypothetical protein